MYATKYGRDLTLAGITFDSYCKFRESVKGDDETKLTTLYYDGSDIVGDVHISFPRYGDAKEKNAVLKKAGEILKFFS